MVGFAAGQAIDILARMIAQSLAEQFSQQFIVENKPGAGGNIAAEAVARHGRRLHAAGDRRQQPDQLDALRQARLRSSARLRTGRRHLPRLPGHGGQSRLPGQDPPRVHRLRQGQPGKINFGSAGTGSVAHVTGEWFKMMAGITMQHVPYRGAPLALADLMSGQVQVMFDNLPSSIEHIRAGRLRALAVSTPAPLELLPGIPTIRVPAGLRDQRLSPASVRRRARRATHRQAQQGCHRGPRRSQDQGTHPRSRRRADADGTRRVRPLPRGGDREVGEGDTGRRYQARLTRLSAGR